MGSGGSGSGGSNGGVDGSGSPGDAAPGEAGGGSSGEPPAAPGTARPSPLCAAGAPMPGPAGGQTVMATGKNRSFNLRLPAGYDGKKPLPVMFGFHGAGGNASGFETGQWGALSRMVADKAIRIYPQGLGNGWSRDEQDDLKFMDALVAWLDTRLCYDKARVYATGHSSGAYFSHRFGCDRSDVIRAVASSSGGQRRERPLAPCKGPVAAWISVGGGDLEGHVWGAQQARDMWATKNGCAAMGTMPTSPSPCVARAGCPAAYPVVYCQHGGGHPPPGYVGPGVSEFLFGGKL